ncbi:MAG: hypothetical protein AB7P02_00615 [Alphaproteobacteria bacterium]
MFRAIAIALAMLPLAAAAHDDADWIRQGGYLDSDGNRCCGPEDCFRVPDGAVRRVPNGWVTPSTGQTWTERTPGFFRSPDLTPWWCVRDGLVRCLFLPPEYGRRQREETRHG